MDPFALVGIAVSATGAAVGFMKLCVSLAERLEHRSHRDEYRDIHEGFSKLLSQKKPGR